VPQLRDAAILKGKARLHRLASLPEALHVVSALLCPSPAARPSAAAVLCHPLWWPPHTQLAFLQEVSLGWG
jgi:serine/threonine-protein kinase/endoribonuclease IRE1